MSENSWTDGINDAFNTSFDPNKDLVNNMLGYKKDLENKKNQLVDKVTSTAEMSLQDADMLRSEIQEMIVSSKVILERLEQTLQIGAPPRAFEVYATLMNSRLATLKELRDLNKTEIDVRVINNKTSDGTGKSVNNNLIMMLDNKQLDQMLKSVAVKNSLTNISTDFEVTEDDIK